MGNKKSKKKFYITQREDSSSFLKPSNLDLNEYKEYVMKQCSQVNDKNNFKSGSSKNIYRKPYRGVKRKANTSDGDGGNMNAAAPVSKLILRKKAKARLRKKKNFFNKKLSKEEEALLAAEQEKLFQRTET